MIKTPRLMVVENTARSVLREMDISSLPICPFAIAKNHGIIVEPKTEIGCSGMLVRLGNEFGILYAKHLANDGYERFSVAHELAHYFLPDHPEHVLAQGAHKSRAGFGYRDPYEREADFFAASLLMPRELFRNQSAKYTEGLEAIQQLANDCRTSLTATAISYAKYGHAAIAVILTSNGRVDCCFLSDAMKAARVGWLREGTSVPQGTLTHSLLNNDSGIPHRDPIIQDVDIVDWFPNAPTHIAEEQVIGLGAYEKNLTIIYSHRLTAKSEEIETEEDEDEELIESWTPRFKR